MQGRASSLAEALREKRHAGEDEAGPTADDDIVRLDGWANLLPVSLRFCSCQPSKVLQQQLLHNLV